MIKKSGQLDQPFVYIFVLVVLAFVVLFGVKYIGKTNELGDQASYLQFKSGMKDAASMVYTKNPGTFLTFSRTSANKPLTLPKGIKEACFQDLGVKSKILLNSNKYADFTITSLSPAEQALCIPIQNQQLSFSLENKVINQETFVIINHV